MQKSLWSLKDINDALDIKLKHCAENFRIIIDSREEKKGDIFLALRGVKFNANCFVNQAIQSGAVLCISDDISQVASSYYDKVIFVNDTKMTLIKLAKHRRSRIHGNVIAVTGSVGKSSVKQFLSSVMKYYGKSYVSRGNYNSQIGLPLSIANAPIGCKYYIFELGMSEPGEMRIISNILSPNIGVILNIKEVHRQSFQNLDEIAKAKLEIIEGMPDKSILILNKEIKQSLYQKDVLKKNINVRLFDYVKHCMLERIKLDCCYKKAYIRLYAKILVQEFSKDLGNHLIFNMQAVFLCLDILKLDPAKAYNVFKKLKPIKGRGKVYYLSNNIILIDESYNSSPVSLEAAISSSLVFKIKGRRFIAVIGDMLELGDMEHSFHQNVDLGGIDQLFCIGKIAKLLFNRAADKQRGGCFTSVNKLLQLLITSIKKNDIILVKGSNALKLGLLVEKIKLLYV